MSITLARRTGYTSVAAYAVALGAVVTTLSTYGVLRNAVFSEQPTVQTLPGIEIKPPGSLYKQQIQPDTPEPQQESQSAPAYPIEIPLVQSADPATDGIDRDQPGCGWIQNEIHCWKGASFTLQMLQIFDPAPATEWIDDDTGKHYPIPTKLSGFRTGNGIVNTGISQRRGYYTTNNIGGGDND